MIFNKSRCGICGKEPATFKLWTKWFCEFHYKIMTELYDQVMNGMLEEDRKAGLEYLMLHNDNVEALK